MSTVANSSHPLSEFSSEVNAEGLIQALMHYRDKIKVLSLDCFDTILLRKTRLPADVFYDLQHRPHFKKLNFTPSLRISGELIARNRKKVQFGTSEVTLNEIYRAHFNHASASELQALAEDELAAEKEACYAYPPAIELILAAQKLGLKIIIVSDTYFTKKQLTELLTAVLPADAKNAINEIYCSCENGKSKSNGLFNLLLQSLKLPPQDILHIGDNKKADYSPARALGINALHFLHHEKIMTDLIRMQALAMNVLDPSVRNTRSLNTPYRGIMALSKVDYTQPDILLGYATLGPLMHAFAKLIIHDVETMRQQGKHVKVVYLLRDAHLPGLACDTISGKAFGQRVRISRFTAYAASFRKKEDIVNYLADVIASERFEDLCKQLLLSEKTTKHILEKTKVAGKPQFEFVHLLQRDDIAREVCQASANYRKRLKKHLEKTIDLQAGDTMLFVDLGYTGTAQKLLAPIFKEEMQVDIIGRYLLALSVPYGQATRVGLLDPSWCDDNTLMMLVAYIAILEQLSTSNEKTAIDFDEEGNAIYAASSINEKQYEKLHAVQHACLLFIKEAELFFSKTLTSWPQTLLRDAGLQALGRLIFLPTENELNYLQAFQFDVNLGTKDTLQVFDREAGLKGLRRRGLFFMEKNLKSMRTNYPSELRAAGLEMTLTLMAQHRYSLEFSPSDWSLRREKINMILMRGNEVIQSSAEALPTHDGYFALLIPLGKGNFQIGLLWGEQYEWLQIEGAELIELKRLYTETESLHTKEVVNEMLFDQMEKNNGQLYRCLSTTSLMAYTPTMPANNDKDFTLRIIFRPITRCEKRH